MATTMLHSRLPSVPALQALTFDHSSQCYHFILSLPSSHTSSKLSPFSHSLALHPSSSLTSHITLDNVLNHTRCKQYSVPIEDSRPVFGARGICCIPISTTSGHNKKKISSLKVSAAVREMTGSVTNVEGLRFALVAGRFNELVTKPLVAGALETFKKHGIKDECIDVVWVPGSFEIPVVAQTLADTGRFHAILCIGAVIRGDTTHYEAVANSAASGVLSAGLKSGVPCIFGVLTCETMDQAFQRAGGKAGNKGAEAAITAIEMASLFQHHFSKLVKNRE